MVSSRIDKAMISQSDILGFLG